ncbi:MAG: hypothetical protein ABIP64_09315 [Burkholderiales bacterium]
MEESKRQERNKQRLEELYPTFRHRLKRVISELEAAGLRPRIQDAWRSPVDQLKAFKSGHSKLKYGFHNVTGPNGEKQSLAVDMVDDNNPLNSGRAYLLQLAAAALRQGLHTGIAWGLPKNLSDAIEHAIAAQSWTQNVKIGWDPSHVEPAGFSVVDAKLGKRPA